MEPVVAFFAMILLQKALGAGGGRVTQVNVTLAAGASMRGGGGMYSSLAAEVTRATYVCMLSRQKLLSK